MRIAHAGLSLILCVSLAAIAGSRFARAQDIGSTTGVLIARRPENPIVRRPARRDPANRESGGARRQQEQVRPEVEEELPRAEMVMINPQMEEAIERGNTARDATPPRYDEAASAYRQAAEVNPRDARAWRGLGNVFYDQRRFAEAEPLFLRAVELNPRDTVTPFYLSFANNELKRYQEAERWARRATEVRPQEYYGYYLLGVSHSRRQQYQQAAAAYQKAIELSPQTATLYYDLGQVYLVENRYRDAAATLQRGAPLEPQNMALQLSYALALQRAARFDEAVTQYRKILQLNPQLTGPHSNLGLVFYLTGDIGQAREAWEAAIKLGTRRPLDAAGLLATAGDAQAALELLEQYTRQRPDAEVGWLMLSDVRRALGDEEGARIAYARGVELVPDYARLTRPTLTVKIAPAAGGSAAGDAGGFSAQGSDANGFTDLMRAASLNRAAAVKTLLTAGAPVNAQDKKGGTALMYAAGQGHEEPVRILIKQGGNANLKDLRGQTALMYAAGQGNAEIVQLLIGGGADVNAKSKSGVTALKLAKARRRNDLAELLQKAGAKN